MLSKDFFKILESNFKHKPTSSQRVALALLSNFLTGKSTDLFVLKGYAGTGKTSIVNLLTKSLPLISKNTVLLAPTGRSAKVLGKYAERESFTIHKKIYTPKSNSSNNVEYVLQFNRSRNTVFIIDEASMISDKKVDGLFKTSEGLLFDLFKYINNGRNNQVILIGDDAQLPPVNFENSPALDPEHLTEYYDKKVFSVELDEVTRQAKDSGILSNATRIREQIGKENYDFEFRHNLMEDVVVLKDGFEIEDAIINAYNTFGKEQTNIIVNSNRRANQYNRQIRSKILGYEKTIVKGDLLMVVKNNYFWLPEEHQANFIANGDVIEIVEIKDHVKLYNLNFVHVMVKMIDFVDQTPFKTILLLDTLDLNTPSFTFEQNQAFYDEVKKDYSSKSNYKKHTEIMKNVYFNALQIKYAYAMTCHKSQGGQWEVVFLEKPFLKDLNNKNYLRWLYTAVTRSKSKLHIIGF